MMFIVAACFCSNKPLIRVAVQFMYILRTTNTRCNKWHCATLLYTIIMFLFLTVGLVSCFKPKHVTTIYNTQSAFSSPRYNKDCLTFNPKCLVHVSCQTVAWLLQVGVLPALDIVTCDVRIGKHRCVSHKHMHSRYVQICLYTQTGGL